MKVSVGIPAFNEEDAIQITLERVLEVLNNAVSLKLCDSFEVLVVDDGSTDKTKDMVRNFINNLESQTTDNPIRLIAMQGNQGHMHALEVCLIEFMGECLITLDADMQDPPETIIEMIRIFSQSRVPCVQAVRVSRVEDSFFKRNSARFYYGMIAKLTGVPLIPNAADFRLLAREEAKLIASLPEKSKVFRLLIPYLKIETITVGISRKSRIAGKSKYTLSKMMFLMLDSLIGFSVKPLRGIIYLSIASLFICFAISIHTILVWIRGDTVAGWTTTTLLILYCQSLTMIVLATIGEYLGRIYVQLLGRPKLRYKELNKI